MYVVAIKIPNTPADTTLCDNLTEATDFYAMYMDMIQQGEITNNIIVEIRNMPGTPYYHRKAMYNASQGELIETKEIRRNLRG